MGKFLISHIPSQVLAFNTGPQPLFPRVPGARRAGKFIAMILQMEELRHRPIILELLETRAPWIEAENRVWSILLCEQNSSHFAGKESETLKPDATDILSHVQYCFHYSMSIIFVQFGISIFSLLKRPIIFKCFIFYFLSLETELPSFELLFSLWKECKNNEEDDEEQLVKGERERK